MERGMSLVADQGMRILKPEVTTEAPYFLASNNELWERWREIQAGHLTAATGMRPYPWRIDIRHLPSGGSVMRLEIHFEPEEK